MRCGTCGARVGTSATFCGKCGVELAALPAVRAPSTPTPLVWKIAGGITLLVGAGLALAFLWQLLAAIVVLAVVLGAGHSRRRRGRRRW